MSKTLNESVEAAPKALWGRELVKLIVTLGALCAAVYGLWQCGGSAGVPRPPALVDVQNITALNRELCGPPTRDGAPVAVSMLYSDDKRSWVEDAADRFARRCPNIQVRLTVMGDIEAADAVLNGEVDPTLWAPADDLVLRYLDHRWKERSREPLFRIEDATSLARSPLVLLIWEDRLRVLEAVGPAGPSGEGPWMNFACALIPRDPELNDVALEDMVPGSWSDLAGPSLAPSLKKPGLSGRGSKKISAPTSASQLRLPTIDEVQQWGRVKLVHTSPTRSSSGLEALYLMAYDYCLPLGERTAPADEDESARTSASSGAAEAGEIVRGERFREAFEDGFAARKERFWRWLRRCEAGLDSAPRSTRLLTETMFNVGASRYDGVLTYEHLAFPLLERIDDSGQVMQSLRVVYPQPTLVNQHPVVFLRPDDPERWVQREAARRWLDFLRSTEMQRRAIDYGFRPAIAEVTIAAYDVETNPFLRLRRYGISFEARIEEPPRLDGRAIHELIDLWENATGRN